MISITIFALLFFSKQAQGDSIIVNTTCKGASAASDCTVILEVIGGEVGADCVLFTTTDRTCSFTKELPQVEDSNGHTTPKTTTMHENGTTLVVFNGETNGTSSEVHGSTIWTSNPPVFRQVPRNQLPEGGPVLECICRWDAKSNGTHTKSLAEMLLDGDEPEPYPETQKHDQASSDIQPPKLSLATALMENLEPNPSGKPAAEGRLQPSKAPAARESKVNVTETDIGASTPDNEITSGNSECDSEGYTTSWNVSEASVMKSLLRQTNALTINNCLLLCSLEYTSRNECPGIAWRLEERACLLLKSADNLSASDGTSVYQVKVRCQTVNT